MVLCAADKGSSREMQRGLGVIQRPTVAGAADEAEGADSGALLNEIG
jgi:hypothetical protein